MVKIVSLSVERFPPNKESASHLHAHAQMCVQYADQAAEGDEKAIAFLAWSAACIAIIGLEAHDRGVTEEDFPIAKPFMDAYSAKIEAEQRSTIH